jgi:hypothetical protein
VLFRSQKKNMFYIWSRKRQYDDNDGDEDNMSATKF